MPGGGFAFAQILLFFAGFGAVILFLHISFHFFAGKCPHV